MALICGIFFFFLLFLLKKYIYLIVYLNVDYSFTIRTGKRFASLNSVFWTVRIVSPPSPLLHSCGGLAGGVLDQ